MILLIGFCTSCSFSADATFKDGDYSVILCQAADGETHSHATAGGRRSVCEVFS